MANLRKAFLAQAGTGISGLAAIAIVARSSNPDTYGVFSLLVLFSGAIWSLDPVRPVLTQQLSTLKSSKFGPQVRGATLASALGLGFLGFALGSQFVVDRNAAWALAAAVTIRGLASLPYAALAAQGHIGDSLLIHSLGRSSSLLLSAAFCLSGHPRHLPWAFFIGSLITLSLATWRLNGKEASRGEAVTDPLPGN